MYSIFWPVGIKVIESKLLKDFIFFWKFSIKLRLELTTKSLSQVVRNFQPWGERTGADLRDGVALDNGASRNNGPAESRGEVKEKVPLYGRSAGGASS